MWVAAVWCCFNQNYEPFFGSYSWSYFRHKPSHRHRKLPLLKETLTPHKNKILDQRIYISGFARRIFLGRQFLKAVERFRLSPIERETQCLCNIWKVLKKANSNVLAHSYKKLHTKADDHQLCACSCNMMLTNRLLTVIGKDDDRTRILRISSNWLDKYCGENGEASQHKRLYKVI